MQEPREATIRLRRGVPGYRSLGKSGLAVLDERQRSEIRHRDRIQRDEEQRKFQDALGTMTAVLDPHPVPLREQAPMLSVVTAVGEALGVAIRPPSIHLAGGDASNLSLQAICRASRVRYRNVLLRGEWWKKDCGPLVGRLQEDQRPVALLRSGNRYDIVDPRSRARTPVDRRSSGRLAHTAFMLYPSLPDSLDRVAGLVKFALKDRLGDVAFVFAVAMLSALLGMLTPQAVAMVMDTAIPDANERLLVELALVLIAAACGRAVFELAQGMVSVRVAVTMESTVQPTLWDRLLNLGAAFFQRYTSGDLLSRVMAVREISKTLNGATLRSLLSGTMALLNLGLLFYYSPRLALIALVFGSGVAAVTLLSGFFLRRYNNARIALEGGFFGFVVQLVNATGKIRSAGAEHRVFAVWAKRYAQQLLLVRKATSVQNGMLVVNQVLPNVSLILLFWFGAGLLEDVDGLSPAQSLSLGVFLAFSVAMAVFIAGITALSNTLLDAIDIVTYGRRIEPLLRAEQEVQASKADPGELTGEIALSHVYFSYNEQGPTVLRDVSMRAEPGEFVALVGTSGSGKTTIFRLLLGFDVPRAGAITFDGRDSNGLDITAIRRQMGIVLQSVRITSGSLLECIGAGQPISPDTAWQVAEDVGLAEDIRAMPMGMHTFLSEGAVSLSGGQRQRLLIARALAHQPKILLMDEATSALDNRTQAIVSASLRRRKVTRLVIAHRLSTVQDADRIYVLDRGQIVQVGTSRELIHQDGVFATLMARQIA